MTSVSFAITACVAGTDSAMLTVSLIPNSWRRYCAGKSNAGGPGFF